MFKKSQIDLGIIALGQAKTIFFDYENLSITKITSPCDCSLPYDDKQNQRMRVIYNPPGSMPEQITKQGRDSFEVRKLIEVEYIDLSQGVSRNVKLYFTATLKA